MSKKFMHMRKRNRKGNLRVELNYTSRGRGSGSYTPSVKPPRQTYSDTDRELIVVSILEHNDFEDTCVVLKESGSDVTLNSGNFRVIERLYEDYGVDALENYSKTGNSDISYYKKNFMKTTMV